MTGCDVWGVGITDATDVREKDKMRNAIILGSGRSGTSMVAGTLAQAGYFMGNRLYEPRGSNPKGFFESPEVNGINEAILAEVLPARPAVIGRWFFRTRPERRQRWLARLPLHTSIPCPPQLRDRIAHLAQREPYCFKDPRFCYTLPAWRPILKKTTFVCVFREPASTATSIVKECRDAHYLHTLSMTFDIALEVWRLMYEHVLRIHCKTGDWLFLHYDQVLAGDGIARLEQRLDVRADRNFPEKKLRRSAPAGEVPARVQRIYRELCEAAGYRLGQTGAVPS